MPTLRDMPIKQKLLVVIVVIGGVALLLSGVAIVTLDSILFRAAMLRDLSALASIVGANSTAALQFDDPKVATETLSVLKARPHMVAACLYQKNATTPFAHYFRPGELPACPTPAAGEQIRFTEAGLIASHPIVLNNGRVGTLVLLYDLREITDRIEVFGGIVLAVLLVSSLIAFLLSSRLRAIIVTPITRLANAARSVSASGDYSIRVERDSADELGILVQSFNEMLKRIEIRDVEIQDARDSLQTTLASIGDAVVSTDTQGRVVFANPVAQSLLGFPAQEMAGKPIGDVFRIINEFTRAPVESPIERVLREGIIVGLANHTILIARDGTEVPIDDSAAPIKQGGRTIGVVLVFRDISERRRAQQDAGYLAAIVESSDDAIIGKSPQGIIQSWNSGAERLYGYKPEEMIGHSMLGLLPPSRQDEEAEILERLRGGSRVVHVETMRVRKDGAEIDVVVTVSPIRDRAGQIVGISHVARDITEEKKNAEQMRQTQRLESLGVLAGGIAHDFNNLLTGILGNASLVLEDLPSESPFRTPIESAMAASEQAAKLARQMLAYSGKGRFVLEYIDLSARVRETLPLIKAAIPPTVELRLNLDEHPPAIEADASQVQQVIMNLIINAAEAIPEGTHGTVTVSTRREKVESPVLHTREVIGAWELAAGPYVVFEVSDTGTGMDEETQARIFDPFFTTKFTGRGLGLAAVLGIVRGHRGSVQVLSALGKGTVFRVMLPAAEDAPVPKPAPPQAPAGDIRGGGLILVVDDEQVVRTLARQTLERYGYTVLLAEDGARGLDMFRREPAIICVVLDLTMPVMSGEETLIRMKSLRSGVPIILSSGFNEVQAIQRFEGKGLAGFLQKPYKAAALAEIVKAVTHLKPPKPE